MSLLEQMLNRLPSPEMLSRVVGELDATPFVDIAGSLRTTNRSGLPAIGYGRGSFAQSDGQNYVAFEKAFRGSEERIAQLLEIYVPIFVGRAPVLDIGCGRGELLDLLAASGVAARGVDNDAGMVAQARAKGHDVEESDALVHLRSLPDASLGAVVSIQTVEHIAPELIQGLFCEAARALRPGGVMVVETINPHSIQAMKTFWIDLTHRHPLFPEVLTVAAGIAGFAEAIVVFPHGLNNLERDRRICTEYALVAQVASNEPGGGQ